MFPRIEGGTISGRLITSVILAGIIISSYPLAIIPNFSIVPAYSQLQQEGKDENIESGDFADSIIAAGVNTPTFIAFSPDRSIFVTEKGGDLRITRPNETGNANPTNQTAIYFPLFAPPGPLWNNMLTYRQAHPDLPWIAIVDPQHGPGQQYEAVYAQNISRLQASDVVVLGYVSTLWSQKDPELVKRDISKYKDWYDVDGILLDEMVSFGGVESLYSGFTEFAKSLGMNIVIGNVGTNTVPSYIGTVDAISTVEGDRTPPISWLKGWQQNYDKSNFVYISYSQSWIDPQYVAESARHVGSLYITDDTMPFPYDDFPAYFDELVAVLDPHGDNSLRTLSVRVMDLKGTVLDGTIPMIISDGTATVATAAGADGTQTTAASSSVMTAPLAHIGAQGSTYTVTALSNSTHTFDHWDDGSTNPVRSVTLDSSKILRAYYRTPAMPDLKSNIVVNALMVKGGQLEMHMDIKAATATAAEPLLAGVTPLVFEGRVAETYVVTATDFNELVFDHWEDGTTNKTRIVSMPGGGASVYLTAYYRFEAAASSSPLAEVTIDTYTLDGTEIRGLWSTITPFDKESSLGRYTPATFTEKSGVEHTVSAEDSSDRIYIFDHWGDNGSTDRIRKVTPHLGDEDVTLTAYYRTAPAVLTVKSADTAGTTLNGMHVTVSPINNSTIQKSFTNSTYIGFVGSAYKVTAAPDYAGMVFDHWEDGSTRNSRTVILDGGNKELTAHYRTAANSVRALTPATHLSEDDRLDLTVNAVTPDGSSLNMWAIIQQEGNGTYKVFAHDYAGYSFDHWEDGSTSRIRTLTIKEATTISAYYLAG